MPREDEWQWARAAVAAMLARVRGMVAAEWQRRADEVRASGAPGM
jgi:hypothetical protein